MKRNNTAKCRKLRKSQTDAERNLWQILRNRQISGIKFRRQFPISSYILDFYCPEYKLGIEADGGQHYEDKGKKDDEQRTKELSKYGVKIVRFSDLDILNNIHGVYEIIQRVIESRKSKTPHLNPLPKGERRLRELKHSS
ncbi:MAG: endonuclease domain-containing protein [Candidatus Omnitrophota bacterium]